MQFGPSNEEGCGGKKIDKQQNKTGGSDDIAQSPPTSSKSAGSTTGGAGRAVHVHARALAAAGGAGCSGQEAARHQNALSSFWGPGTPALVGSVLRPGIYAGGRRPPVTPEIPETPVDSLELEQVKQETEEEETESVPARGRGRGRGRGQLLYIPKARVLVDDIGPVQPVADIERLTEFGPDFNERGTSTKPGSCIDGRTRAAKDKSGSSESGNRPADIRQSRLSSENTWSRSCSCTGEGDTTTRHTDECGSSAIWHKRSCYHFSECACERAPTDPSPATKRPSKEPVRTGGNGQNEKVTKGGRHVPPEGQEISRGSAANPSGSSKEGVSSNGGSDNDKVKPACQKRKTSTGSRERSDERRKESRCDGTDEYTGQHLCKDGPPSHQPEPPDGQQQQHSSSSASKGTAMGSTTKNPVRSSNGHNTPATAGRSKPDPSSSSTSNTDGSGPTATGIHGAGGGGSSIDPTASRGTTTSSQDINSGHSNATNPTKAATTTTSKESQARHGSDSAGVSTQRSGRNGGCEDMERGQSTAEDPNGQQQLAERPQATSETCEEGHPSGHHSQTGKKKAVFVRSEGGGGTYYETYQEASQAWEMGLDKQRKRLEQQYMQFNQLIAPEKEAQVQAVPPVVQQAVQGKHNQHKDQQQCGQHTIPPNTYAEACKRKAGTKAAGEKDSSSTSGQRQRGTGRMLPPQWRGSGTSEFVSRKRTAGPGTGFGQPTTGSEQDQRAAPGERAVPVGSVPQTETDCQRAPAAAPPAETEGNAGATGQGKACSYRGGGSGQETESSGGAGCHGTYQSEDECSRTTQHVPRGDSKRSVSDARRECVVEFARPQPVHGRSASYVQPVAQDYALQDGHDCRSVSLQPPMRGPNPDCASSSSTTSTNTTIINAHADAPAGSFTPGSVEECLSAATTGMAGILPLLANAMDEAGQPLFDRGRLQPPVTAELGSPDYIIPSTTSKKLKKLKGVGGKPPSKQQKAAHQMHIMHNVQLAQAYASVREYVVESDRAMLATTLALSSYTGLQRAIDIERHVLPIEALFEGFAGVPVEEQKWTMMFERDCNLVRGHMVNTCDVRAVSIAMSIHMGCGFPVRLQRVMSRRSNRIQSMSRLLAVFRQNRDLNGDDLTGTWLTEDYPGREPSGPLDVEHYTNLYARVRRGFGNPPKPLNTLPMVEWATDKRSGQVYIKVDGHIPQGTTVTEMQTQFVDKLQKASKATGKGLLPIGKKVDEMVMVKLLRWRDVEKFMAQVLHIDTNPYQTPQIPLNPGYCRGLSSSAPNTAGYVPPHSSCDQQPSNFEAHVPEKVQATNGLEFWKNCRFCNTTEATHHLYIRCAHCECEGHVSMSPDACMEICRAM